MTLHLAYVGIAPFSKIKGGTHALWRYQVTLDSSAGTDRIGIGFSRLLDIRDPNDFDDVAELAGTALVRPTGSTPIQLVVREVSRADQGRLDIAFVAPSTVDKFAAVALAAMTDDPDRPRFLAFRTHPNGVDNTAQAIIGPGAVASASIPTATGTSQAPAPVVTTGKPVVPEGLLPYASEPFGVYQPLLGWHSALNHENLATATTNRFLRAASMITPAGPASSAGPIVRLAATPAMDRTGTAVGRQLAAHLAATPPQDSGDWQTLLGPGEEAPLGSITRAVMREHHPFADRALVINPDISPPGKPASTLPVPASMSREAAAASLLHYLGQTSPETVAQMFRATVPTWRRVLAGAEWFAQPNPSRSAFLSPIGILHLFRQYFFELGTFLGPPVGHVWLSPGGTVELVEVNTRRTLVERTVEQSVTTTQKTELATTDQDELSDAVKVENATDMRLGVTATGSGGVAGVFQASASASFNLDSSRKQAQEQTHKRMREQSSKLSSEVRQNYKTTFRTVTETTDTSSRRYLLQNSTEKLVSYQLSRKMRKVAVQVQDLGQQLCWQLYVDNPGDALGLGEFVHATSAALDPGVKAPDYQPYPDNQQKTFNLNIPFILYQGSDSDAEDTYELSGDNRDHGKFVPVAGEDDIIQFKFDFKCPPAPAGFVLAGIGSVDFHGAQVKFTTDPNEFGGTNPDPATDSFSIRLTHANFGGKPSLPFDATLIYAATAAARQAVDKHNADLKATYDDQVALKKEQLFYDTLRTRLKLVGQVRTRPQTDLRAEERNMIYRAIIRRLYGSEAGWTNDDYHVASELIRYLFDVDSMLYFVAPDWWRPRQQQLASKDNQGELQPTIIADVPLTERVKTIGKARPKVQPGHRPYYLITEETVPAPEGASLGWLIQLDGDAHRNAFLNSPWAKAVLPIRPGRERDAMAWLRRPEVAGTDGLSEPYPYDPNVDPKEYEGLSIAQVLLLIADKIRAEYQASLTPVPVDKAAVNPRLALPTEVVFSKGFDPLEGGIKFGAEAFQVFSQWLEILPTEQVVATVYEPGN